MASDTYISYQQGFLWVAAAYAATLAIFRKWIISSFELYIKNQVDSVVEARIKSLQESNLALGKQVSELSSLMVSFTKTILEQMHSIKNYENNQQGAMFSMDSSMEDIAGSLRVLAKSTLVDSNIEELKKIIEQNERKN